MNTSDPPSSHFRTVPPLRATPAQARRAPVDPGHLTAQLMRHGSMELRWYAPQSDDKQVPHDRDELYFIQSGSAVFVRAEESIPFNDDVMVILQNMTQVEVHSGDVLFVPAGAEHRFTSMSTDFGAWVVFYGPEGGEQP